MKKRTEESTKQGKPEAKGEADKKRAKDLPAGEDKSAQVKGGSFKIGR